MEKVVSRTSAGDDDRPEAKKIETTLYDLIAAVSEEIEPGEERLIVQVVWRILRLSHAA